MPKAGIHPTYYPNATVTCSCGATHTIGSTKESLKVEICKECHPFYTGTQKLIDTAGRVDRFRERMAQAKPRTEAKVEDVKEVEVKEEVTLEAEAPHGTPAGEEVTPAEGEEE